jgi:hypothetical protein
LRDITWWRNTGSAASWQAHIVEGNYKGAWPLFVGDLDNDGDNDLITGADVPTGNSPLTVWKNMLPPSSSQNPVETDKHNCLTIYPDPFSTTTNVDFTTDKPGMVRLGVYNLQGALVKELINKSVNPGSHTITFDGTSLGSGYLLFRLETGGRITSHRAVLAK